MTAVSQRVPDFFRLKPFRYDDFARGVKLLDATAVDPGALGTIGKAFLQRQAVQSSAYAASLTLNLANARHLNVTTALTGDLAVTLTNGRDGDVAFVSVLQNAAGSHAVSFLAAGRTVIVPDGQETQLLAASMAGGLARWRLEYGSACEVPYVIARVVAADALSPLAIFGSGLRVWWRPDAGAVTLNTGKVSTWFDQSGNGFNLTHATPSVWPTYDATGGPNGTPRLAFVDLSSTITLACDLTAAVNVGDYLSCFFVASLPSLGTYPGKKVANWAGQSFTLSEDSSRPQLTFAVTNTGSFVVDQTELFGYSDANAHAHALVAGAQFYTAYRDDVDVTGIDRHNPVQPVTAALGNGGLRGGAPAGNNRPVYYSEFLFVRGAVSAAQVTGWNTYVATRYGL